MGSPHGWRKKLKPHLWRGNAEPIPNSKTSSKVKSTTEAANKKVIIRAISSPSRSRERNQREPETGPAPGTVVIVLATFRKLLPDLAEPFHLSANDFLGELRPSERLVAVVPSAERALQERLDG